MSEPKLPPGFELVPSTGGVRVPAGFELVPSMPADSTVFEGVDFKQDREKVRAGIAGLPAQKRQGALDAWSKHFVGEERKGQGIVGAMDDVGRSVARGVPIVGPFADEITAISNGVMHTLTGGRYAAPYDETVAYQRAKDKAFDKANPITSMGLQFAGGIGGAGAAIKTIQGAGAGANAGLFAAGAPRLAPTATGRVGQAAAVGGTQGAVSGFGNAEGSADNRLSAAVPAAAIGVGLGAVLGGGVEGYRKYAQARVNQGETGAYNKITEKLPGSVDDFADQVATGAGTNQLSIQRRTLDVLGDEMNRSGGDVAVAQHAAVQRLMAENNISQSAAQAQIRRLSEQHRNSPLMMAEYPAVAESNAVTRLKRPENVEFAEASRIEHSGTQDLLDYIANSGAQRSAQNVRNSVHDRQSGLADWVQTRLEDMAPRNASGQALSVDDAASNIERMRVAGSQAYRQADAAEQPWLLDPVIRFWNRRLDGRQSAHAEKVSDAVNLFQNRVQSVADDGRVMSRDLDQLQPLNSNLRDFRQRRRELGDMITQARNTGNRELARDLTMIKHMVDSQVARHNPQWVQANRRWSQIESWDDALEFGQRMTDKASIGKREALRDFQGMAPEGQDMVRVGWLQKQYDKLSELRDTNDPSKVFDTQSMMTTVNTLFGRDAAVRFVRAVRDAEVANRTKNSLGNSATHRRGMMQKDLDADTGLASAVESASVRGARGWLMETLGGMMRERRNRPMADILTTDMRDTARVAQHISGMRTAQRQQASARTPSGQGAEAAGAFGRAAGTISATNNSEKRK